jgi:hypothetical protein
MLCCILQRMHQFAAKTRCISVQSHAAKFSIHAAKRAQSSRITLQNAAHKRILLALSYLSTV